MEVELKQRLVGASVIIALAIIFIPMIFDESKISQNQSITIEIPDEPSGLKHKILKIDSSQPPVKTDVVIPETSVMDNVIDENQAPTINPKPVIKKEETIIDMVDYSKPTKNSTQVAEIPVDKVGNKVTDKVKDKPPVKETQLQPKTSNVNLTYRIKYGAFSQQKNAQQLKAKIINAGYSAIVEHDIDKNIYKVHSKFLNNKQAAQSLSNKIQKLKLNIGKPVIELLTDEQVQNSEILLDTGWIIQIGIFSSKQNSIKLRDKIRKKGFVAFVDEIKNNKNQNLYRVRVGPFATREEADTIKSNIKKKMNLKGLLKPHEKQKVVN